MERFIIDLMLFFTHAIKKMMSYRFYIKYLAIFCVYNQLM